MTKSDSIAHLIAALAKAQGAFANVTKGNANTFLDYKYASLDDVLEAVRKPLADNGLAILQAPGTMLEGAIQLETFLAHESGEFIFSETSIPVSEKKGLSQAQTVGVAITYARRYALMAMLGIAAEGDDQDGHGTGQERPAAKIAADGPRQEAAPPQQSWGGRDAALARAAMAVQYYKDTLLTTTSDSEVDRAVSGLLAELPGFDETKHWTRVVQLASERKNVLAARPVPAPRRDDALDQADSDAVNGPPEVGGDPEEPAHDPDTGEILEEQPHTPGALLIQMESFRDAIRGKRSAGDLIGFTEDVLRPFFHIHGDTFDGACKERWDDIRAFYAARLEVLTQTNGGK
jgi:hypothetical protein